MYCELKSYHYKKKHQCLFKTLDLNEPVFRQALHSNPRRYSSVLAGTWRSNLQSWECATVVQVYRLYRVIKLIFIYFHLTRSDWLHNRCKKCRSAKAYQQVKNERFKPSRSCARLERASTSPLASVCRLRAQQWELGDPLLANWTIGHTRVHVFLYKIHAYVIGATADLQI